MPEHTETQETEREDLPEEMDRRKVIRYSVNGEAQETKKHKLTVREILTNAGFTPAEEYELTRDRDHHTFTNLDEVVRIHKGESFTATFTGPTPTS